MDTLTPSDNIPDFCFKLGVINYFMYKQYSNKKGIPIRY